MSHRLKQLINPRLRTIFSIAINILLIWQILVDWFSPDHLSRLKPIDVLIPLSAANIVILIIASFFSPATSLVISILANLFLPIIAVLPALSNRRT